jgi:hypothetical protein
MNYLAHINSTGSCLSALSTAIETNLYFAKPTNFELRFDGSLTAPVMQITLTPLEQLDRVSRLLALLEGLLNQDAVREIIKNEQVQHIHFVLPQQNSQHILSDIELKNLLSAHFNAIPTFSQQQNSHDNLPLGTLLLVADSLVTAESFVGCQVQDLQLMNGPPGYTPAEGACAFFNEPHKTLTRIDYQGSLSEQLQTAKASVNDCYIFTGQPSDRWVTQWFAATQPLYTAKDHLIESLQSDTVIGFLGVCQPWMDKVIAQAMLSVPFSPIRERVLIVTNTPTANISIYARSK